METSLVTLIIGDRIVFDEFIDVVSQKEAGFNVESWTTDADTCLTLRITCDIEDYAIRIKEMLS